MDLIIASTADPASYNMANFISKNMVRNNNLYKGPKFDLLIINDSLLNADWITKYNYDSFIFLSKHMAKSKILSLTCHTTGLFTTQDIHKRVSVPYPDLQKSYILSLWSKKNYFHNFKITVEATHHGPVLNKPTLFIEIGTTTKQWNDKLLCGSIANILIETLTRKKLMYPHAICIGGNHYSKKFTYELIHGKYAIGTIIPQYALDIFDIPLFENILLQNKHTKTIMVDYNSLGKNKQRILNLISSYHLNIIKI